jgi:predicted DNA-binding antitoxin AbrB/MazE fold protein
MKVGFADRRRTDMERIEVVALYEDGILKLPHALPLASGQKVTITIHPTGTAGQRLRGLIQWTGSQEDLDHLLGPDNTPCTGEDE